MQGLPKPVTDVTVWPEVHMPPHLGIGPVVPPVIEHGRGTYTVGTLFLDVFYNLDLTQLDLRYPLHAGARYVAQATAEDGSVFRSPALICLNDGPRPRFGRTSGPGLERSGAAASTSAAVPQTVASHDVGPGDLIQLAALKDVSITYTLPRPAIGTVEYASGCPGELVAARTGTPHLTGFTVQVGGRGLAVAVGSTGYSVTGRRVDNGDFVSLGNLTCRASGTNPVFLQSFPA
ncbi:MAG: hypothetical protein AAFP86_20015 [Planctomycetota bacterium]